MIKVLDGLTKEQVRECRTSSIEAQEKTSLKKDLFEGGQSDAPANLTVDEQARIEVLLGGTRRRGGR